MTEAQAMKAAKRWGSVGIGCAVGAAVAIADQAGGLSSVSRGSPLVIHELAFVAACAAFLVYPVGLVGWAVITWLVRRWTAEEVEEMKKELPDSELDPKPKTPRRRSNVPEHDPQE